MKRRRSLRSRVLAFTLVEMLVVLAIIGLMGALFLPSMKSAIMRAQSVKCSANLHAIGVAASLSATDHNNTYPEIDQAGDQADPIYSDGNATNLIGAFGPYGITSNSLQCPVDMTLAPSSFKSYGSSYEWDPVFDNEPVNEPVIYISPTTGIPVNSARVRLAMDFNGIHQSRHNVLYGDGHVRYH